MNDLSKPRKLGKYEIKAVLGQGAMGVVYQARDPDIERNVAIKVLHPHLLDTTKGKSFKERFRREAQAAARCIHPNIVTVFELGHDNDLEFIVMEYVQGEELKFFLDTENRFSLDESVHIISEVLKALSSAHGQGVVHRDIKPANIMLLDDGSVKVADFGVAHIEQSDLTMSGHMVGTPNYMSPEGLRGEQVDHRADLYSTGVVLLELLTGRRPKLEELYKTPIRTLVDEIFDSPSGEMVSAGVCQIIYRALSEDKNDRFESADDFIEALLASIDDRPDVGTVTEQLSETVLNQRPLHKDQPGPDSPAMWDEHLLLKLEQDLASYLGPMSGRLVRKHSSDDATVEDLIESLASYIEDAEEKKRFVTNTKALFSAAGNALAGTNAPLNETLSDGVVDTISLKLAFHIGPIARKFVTRKSKQTTDINRFFDELSQQVPEGKERIQFVEEIRQISLAVVRDDVESVNGAKDEAGRKQMQPMEDTHLDSRQEEVVAESVLKPDEMAQPQYLNDYQVSKPEQAIVIIKQEQVRLLEFMMRSLEALRAGRKLGQIKQIHASSRTLSELIDNAIQTILKDARLSATGYEHLTTLLDNQQQLMLMNDTMETLASELKHLVLLEVTRPLSLSAVEGLDVILLTVLDLAKAYNMEDLALLKSMTSRDEKGLAAIRKKYLDDKADLDSETRSILLASTTHMEQLKSFFGLVGDNYRKLAAGA